MQSILYPVVSDLFEMKIEICHLPAKIFQCPSIRPLNKNQTFAYSAQSLCDLIPASLFLLTNLIPSP